MTDVVKVDPAKPDEQHVVHISSTLDESRAVELQPVTVSLGLDPSVFKTELGGVPAGSTSRYSLAKGVFDAALRAPAGVGNLIWFFRGDRFFTYEEDQEAGIDELHGPRLIAAADGASFATNWPAKFASGIDAALLGTGRFSGQIWFFKGNEYVSLSAGHVAGPDPIEGSWRDVHAPFTQGIDAALHGLREAYGACWFFKGSQYLRYDLESNTAVSAPHPIADNWGGGTWPATFADGIDLAFYGTGAEAEKIYFFRGDQYILYDLKIDRVEEGPTPIVKNWRKLGQFVPPPQLYIQEQYAIRSFRGQVGLGPSVEGLQVNVAAHASTEFFILTKKSETITESSKRNILESQSEQAAKSFSEATRGDETNIRNRAEFGSGFESSSFHGTLDRDPEGDVKKMERSASELREDFANVVSHQTAKQEAETHESHSQQVTTDAASHVINQEIESGFKQTIDNSDNPRSLNILMYQLTQEYVVALSLVGAGLAFHNGDPRDTQVVSIRGMAQLLEHCIVEPASRAAISSAVINVLEHIQDHAGKTISLVTPTSGDPVRFEVDQSLTSSLAVTDSPGAQRRVAVPGIVMNVDRPIVLTLNTVLVPAEIG